jgi:hypothetical protein
MSLTDSIRDALPEWPMKSWQLGGIVIDYGHHLHWSFGRLSTKIGKPGMSIETQIDQLCDKYEDAWNAGKSPSIGKVLEKIPATHHATILKRLIPVDVELRMQAGLSVVSDDYAAFGPAAVDLATQTIEKLAPTTESPLPDDVLNQPTIIGPGNEQSPSVNLTESQILDSFHKVTRPQEASPMIGPYKILQKIAEGGMGIVFMAEQTHPVRRRVALKLIKAGMDSKDIITRFEAERQALALMDHPNIAKVLDAGTTKDGRPYFVMELVQGIPVTEYCDKQKLSVEDRLEPSSMPIKRGSSTGISNHRTYSSLSTTAFHLSK